MFAHTDYVWWVCSAMPAATAYEMPLAQRLIDELRGIPHVKVQGITAASRLSERVPTVSITHPHHRSTLVAKALAEQGINVWSGHNYAFELVRYLGLDEQEGVVRIGLAHYTTEADVDQIVHSLKKLQV